VKYDFFTIKSNSAIAGFEDEITSLQKKRLTNEELVKYTLEKIKDKEMINEEARAFTMSKLK
jgi:hypothetical protein